MIFAHLKRITLIKINNYTRDRKIYSFPSHTIIWSFFSPFLFSLLRSGLDRAAHGSRVEHNRLVFLIRRMDDEYGTKRGEWKKNNNSIKPMLREVLARALKSKKRQAYKFKRIK